MKSKLISTYLFASIIIIIIIIIIIALSDCNEFYKSYTNKLIYLSICYSGFQLFYLVMVTA